MWKQLLRTFILLGGFFLLAQLDDSRAQDQKEKIEPGSALEKLISNATAHNLFQAASVATTDTGHKIRSDIPTWLRAHYMRNHAGTLTAAHAKDPTGGFPLALDSLYVWMLHNQDLEPKPAPQALAAAPATVGPNVLISGQNTTPRSESDIRINSANPMQIISASNNLDNGRQAQFYSSNGGTAWGQTTLPLVAGDSLHSDPTVDWTSDGTAWATTIGIAAGSTTLQLRSYKSTDAGQHWMFDSTISGDQTSADKQMTWIDHSATSTHRDNMYIVWHNNAPAFVNRKTAAGWGAPHQVSGAETTGTAIGSDITTNSAGEVFVVWPDTGSQKLFLAKSVDGGASYSAAAQLAKTFGSFQIHVPSFAERGALIGVSIAAFKNTTRNDVYVSWIDLSGESGCDTPESEPGDEVTSGCKSRVWFARSVDGGATWGAPQKINALATKSDQFNQRLAVDPATGNLGIIYYGSGAGNNRKKTDLYFQASNDNGATWSSALKVTSVQSDETSTGADSGNQYGDYNGLSVANGVFFPSWTDRRKPSEAIYTAKITLTTPGGVLTPTIAAP